MQKKQGTPEPLVPAIQAEETKESDKANPGQVQAVKSEQRQAEKGKYGSVPVTPFKPAEKDPASERGATQGTEEKNNETTWIEIELVGEDNKPVAGEKYRITLPDGTVAEGTLDQKGQARAEGFEPGTCTITFPDLDADMWEENK